MRATQTWSLVLLLFTTFVTGVPTRAATPLEELRHSPDTTVVLDGVTVDDEDAVIDDLAGSTTIAGLGSLPPNVDLDAYHLLFWGDSLMSFDTTVELPGSIVAHPGDVVRYDGVDYALEFEAAANGIPNGVAVDAVTRFDVSTLLLSFDVSVQLDGVVFDDEDLTRFDGGGFSLFFDGSAAGVAPGLDVDAVHYVVCNGNLLFSFDGSGTIGPVDFDDEDVLEYDPDTMMWELAYDGSAAQAGWPAADLDGLHATIDLGPGPPVVFGQTILIEDNKMDITWPNPAAFHAIRGPFASPTDIGDYAADASATGDGSQVSDPTTPAATEGFWYLVKPGGCQQTSWQTTLGAEPPRDASLP